MQDRLRDGILLTWQSEFNARCGHNGVIREDITRIEVVELQHRRSRALGQADAWSEFMVAVAVLQV